MYCPKCGTQNSEDVKFCRSCGANLSLVPQALTGQLPVERAVGYDSEGKPYDRHGRRIENPPTIARGIQHLFLGIGFLIIAAVLFITGQRWGLWMLIPAFGLLGKGASDIAAVKSSERLSWNAPRTARSTGELPTSEAYNPLPPHPPSVTENTTRHLDQTRDERPRNTR
jgi:hypothetical protein